MDEALEYLEEERNSRPELAGWFEKFADLYKRKLWHQLGLELKIFVTIPEASDTLVPLYGNFVTMFATKMNPMIFASIVVMVARKNVDDQLFYNAFLTDALKFMDDMKGSLVKQALFYFLMEAARSDLESKNFEGCQRHLQDGMDNLETYSEIDPALCASFYYVSSEYHKARDEFSDHYKNAILYLAYEDPESLTENRKQDLAFDLSLYMQDLAFDLSLSALQADNIYNFGELLSHPIINSLPGTNREWMNFMLQALNTGNVKRFLELHRASFRALSVLVKNKQPLLEKIKALRLMEIIFSWPSADRIIPLSTISAQIGLSIDVVEYLLMRSFSVHLIEGIIDQVEGIVYISWLQPRVLDIAEIIRLRFRLDDWLDKVHTALMLVEAGIDDTFA